MLYERGLLSNGMTWAMGEKRKKDLEKSLVGPDAAELKTYMSYVLSQCPDFKSEVPEIQKIWEEGGELFSPSVKGHPELAGSGIEYVWGFMKRYFRRHNDNIAGNFHMNVKVAMAQVEMTNIWSFARRTRDYSRCYSDDAGSGDYNVTEQARKLMKESRCHRSVLDDEGTFLRQEEERSGQRALAEHVCTYMLCGGQTFSSRQKLFAHLRTSHGIDGRHKCEVCSTESFPTKKQLFAHLKGTHNFSDQNVSDYKHKVSIRLEHSVIEAMRQVPPFNMPAPTGIRMNIEGGQEHFTTAGGVVDGDNDI